MQFIKHIIKSRDRVAILYGDIVDGPAIYAHSLSLIILWYQKHWYCTWTHALADIPFAQQLFHLPLKFLCLIGIASIGGPIWNNCSGYKVNLVLYSSNWW